MGRGESDSVLARRSFLARFGAGATAFGAAFASGASIAGAQSPAGPATAWQPARHPEDDWFEQVSAKHRVFFDTTSAEGFGEAILFANNTFTANRTGYGLTDADIALVICARHQSTPFAYTDAHVGEIRRRARGTRPLQRPEDQAATDRQRLPGRGLRRARCGTTASSSTR